MTLTLLLANAGPTDGFMAYSCEDMRSTMVGYELAPQAGCWMKQLAHANPKPRDGRIVWMRDNNFMSHFEGHFEGAKTFLTP